MADKKTPEKPPPATPVAPRVPPKTTAVAMPGSWRDHMKSVAVKVAEAEKPQGGFISFKSGRLNIGDQQMPGDKIECIVVDSLLHNKYFDTPYNANKVVPPVCYAFAREEENMAPPGPKGEEGEEGYNPGPEDPQSDNCAECPLNAWGSDPRGGRGKGCTNSRRLWLLPADVVNDPLKVARTEFLQCDLPATSVKNYSKFVTDCAPEGLPPFAYIVEMSVKVHPTSLFQVHFKVLEQIKNEAILEQMANRQWRQQSEPFPMYPTKEEMAERQAGGSTKY